MICLIGYETPGSRGYVDHLLAEARRLGVAHRFESLGSLTHRSELMLRSGECDVGLSMLAITPSDINMQHMAGASNKPFDYASQGLAIVVSRDPEWEELFVKPGCAIACEHGNPEELTSSSIGWPRIEMKSVRWAVAAWNSSPPPGTTKPSSSRSLTHLCAPLPTQLSPTRRAYDEA